MKLFGYDIKNKRQPGINEKLKNERMLLIRSLDNPKLAVKSSHKILFQKYKKFTDNINNESNKKNIKVKEKENNSLSHKRSKKRLFPLHPKQNIKIDYLTEMIAQKEKKKAISTEKDLKEENFNKEKWNKEVNNKNGSVTENINYIKEQTKIIDDKVKQKEQYLKLAGGVENNPEIGQEMSELIIDSIGAKLSILNVCK